MARRLIIGETTTGRGFERRYINVVMTPDDKVIARFDVNPFGQGPAHEYVRAYEAGMDDPHPVHPSEMAEDCRSVGDLPFTSTVCTLTYDGRAYAHTGSLRDLQAWREGWLRALKDRGLLTRKGTMKTPKPEHSGTTSV